jgi:hypothetical protein
VSQRLGLLVRVTIEDKKIVKVTCVPVRHNEANETLIRSATDECDAMDKLIAASQKLGASLAVRGDEAEGGLIKGGPSLPQGIRATGVTVQPSAVALMAARVLLSMSSV